MPMTLHIAYRPNIRPATVRRVDAEAALIDDGVEFLTGRQIHHIRAPLSAFIAKTVVRQAAARQVA